MGKYRVKIKLIEEYILEVYADHNGDAIDNAFELLDELGEDKANHCTDTTSESEAIQIR